LAFGNACHASQSFKSFVFAADTDIITSGKRHGMMPCPLLPSGDEDVMNSNARNKKKTSITISNKKVEERISSRNLADSELSSITGGGGQSELCGGTPTRG
jgi:hypothetical protein